MYTFFLRSTHNQEDFVLFSVELDDSDILPGGQMSGLAKEQIYNMISAFNETIFKKDRLIFLHRSTISELEARITKTVKKEVYEKIFEQIEHYKASILMIEENLRDDYQVLSRLRLLLDILENNKYCEILYSKE